MKQLILGDIHGRTIWKKILESENDVDRLVFIGDYVDTHNSVTPSDQLDNLNDIIHFKRDTNFDVVLLVGNHDYHYWPTITERYSGFQPSMLSSFRGLYESNSDLFQMAFADEYGRLFTHAGVTESFLRRLEINPSDSSNIAMSLNEIFKFQPRKFGFHDGDWSGYGEDVRQGCIWVRPQSLHSDAIDKLQIVGHTTVNRIFHPQTDPEFYLIDALENGYYLLINNDKIEIKQFKPSQED